MKGGCKDIEDPTLAIQAHVYDLSEQFNSESILGLPIGTIAGETALTHEMIRNVCMSAFKDWQSLYIEKLLDFGYSDIESKETALVLNAMIDGGAFCFR